MDVFIPADIKSELSSLALTPTKTSTTSGMMKSCPSSRRNENQPTHHHGSALVFPPAYDRPIPTTSSVEVLITTIQTVTQPKESQLPTNMAAVDISAETNQFLQYKVYRLV